MTKRTIWAALALAGATAAATAYWGDRTDAAAPAFTTAAVTRGAVVDVVAATGTLQPVKTVDVGSQVSGAIASLHADYNDQVRKGQVIARLDPSLFQTQVEQARATVLRLQADVERSRVELTDARQKLARAEALSREQLLASSDLDVARTTVLQAEAAVKSAEAQVVQARASLNQVQVNLGHTTITAPIDGIVVSRSVDVGQTVAASMQAPTLFVLAGDLAQMQVNASVDESDIGRIAAGQPVTFTVDAYPGDTFSGTVRQVRLEPVVTQNVVSYVTVIDVANPDHKLKPGMTAGVSIEVARADDVLRVPTAAFRFRGPEGADTDGPGATEGPTVWVQRPEGLSRVPVTLGISDGTTTAVTSGALDEDARVVTGATAVSASASTTSSSPLIPQRPGRARSGQAGAGASGGAR